MASIIDGTTGSSIAGDATITGNLTVTGTATVNGVPVGGNYNLVAYTSPTTWDATAAKAAGLKAVKITVVGAGGNGGTCPGAVGQGNNSTGGGAGGGAIAYVPAASITPGTKTVTAGPGTNSFGPWGTATPFSPTATVSATAGTAGSNANLPISGGAGGTGSGGSVNFTGGGGGSYEGLMSGFGGNSIFGGGAPSISSPASRVVGIPGGNYGGGGGGANNASAPATPVPASPGGTGAPGVVIIEEFY